MNYLSICVLVKNEALYIDEWLKFHLRQGFDHFYIFHNESTDNTEDIIRSYPADLVTVENVYGRGIQRQVYDNYIETHRDKSVWTAFIDVDEFLYPVASPYNFRELFQKEYDDNEISGLAVNWLLFGSSGHIEYSPEPVTKRFTRRAADVNPHVKTIVKNMDAIKTFDNVHAIKTVGPVVDETKSVLHPQYSLHYDGTCDVFAINHYVTKSEEECKIRRAAPRADTGGIREATFFESHDVNEIEDLRIQRWI